MANQNLDGILLQIKDKTFHIEYNSINNLPTFQALSHDQSPNNSEIESHVILTGPTNQNLSLAQKELFRWHFRLGHFHVQNIQNVMRSGILGTSPLINAASRCETITCPSCQYCRAKKRPTGDKVINPTNTHSLVQTHLLRGSCVSTVNFSVSEKGRLSHSRDKTSTDLMCTGGYLSCDHASGFLYIHLHPHKNPMETIEAELKFEQEMYNTVVLVRQYYSDNGNLSARPLHPILLITNKLFDAVDLAPIIKMELRSVMSAQLSLLHELFWFML
jgi:hypothetical protein